MMRKIALILSILSFPIFLIGQTYQPYTIGVKSKKSIRELKSLVSEKLNEQSLTVVGEYMPAKDSNRWIVIVTHQELQQAAQSLGGLRGFALTLRVGITVESDGTIISFTTPEYWGRAYYQDDYDKVAKHYQNVQGAFQRAMAGIGNYDGSGFGSKKGLDAKDLTKYHYMLGMPYFDDNVELGEFDNQAAAIKKIDANIKKGVPNLTMVYKVESPDRKMALYGFALGGENGESKFLPIIDISSPKHTAFLPYEVLVVNGKAYMLHGRFRIALSFPDLTMGTFTKIMSTPGDIEDMLEKIAE
jgi:hypothetical protein